MFGDDHGIATSAMKEIAGPLDPGSIGNGLRHAWIEVQPGSIQAKWTRLRTPPPRRRDLPSE